MCLAAITDKEEEEENDRRLEESEEREWKRGGAGEAIVETTESLDRIL